MTTMRTRLVSRSAACRLRCDLGSTTLCVICLPLCLISCLPCVAVVRLDHVITYVSILCIHVMDGVYLHANFACCSRLIVLGS